MITTKQLLNLVEETTLPHEARFLKTPHGHGPIVAVAYGDCQEAQVTVVLTPGGMQSASCWQLQLRHLVQHNILVLTWEPSGHGYSVALPEPEPGVLMLERWAEELETVLAAFAPVGPVILAAWSLGGCIVGEFLRRQQVASPALGNLAGLVLIATHLDPRLISFAEEAQPLIEALSRPGLQLQDVRNFTERLCAQPLARTLQERVWGYNFQSWSRLPTTTIPMNWFAVRSSLSESSAFLHQLQLPTLIIQGEQDALVARATAHDLVSRLPQAQVLLYPHTGHSPHMECHEKFNQDVLSFLQALPTTQLGS